MEEGTRGEDEVRKGLKITKRQMSESRKEGVGFLKTTSVENRGEKLPSQISEK